MKISQVIAELAQVMAEYGDIEVVATEWAGASSFPINIVRYDDQDEWGHPIEQVYIGTEGRYGTLDGE